MLCHCQLCSCCEEDLLGSQTHGFLAALFPQGASTVSNLLVWQCAGFLVSLLGRAFVSPMCRTKNRGHICTIFYYNVIVLSHLWDFACLYPCWCHGHTTCHQIRNMSWSVFLIFIVWIKYYYIFPQKHLSIVFYPQVLSYPAVKKKRLKV